MNNQSKVFVAGHRGMVGSAIVRKLQEYQYTNLVLTTSKELDLRDQKATADFFKKEKPEYVFLAAAKVGGIMANKTYPAEFINDNLSIQLNVIHQSFLAGVKKLLFLGSSCIYPKFTPQPIKEEYLLTGILETTNEAYAIAKIAGIKMCQAYHLQNSSNFISVMPSNLYGTNDNYDLQSSHVLPALIRKFHEAHINGDPFVELWGTGIARREFLHVNDLAEACFFLMQNYNDPEIINVGTGEDITINELALLIKEVVGYGGELKYDSTKPDGTLYKVMDISKLRQLGFPKYTIQLKEGIKTTYENFKEKFQHL